MAVSAKSMVRSTLTVDGVNLGECRTLSDGAFSMTERKHVNAAGQGARARPGRKTTENVTGTIADDQVIDGLSLLAWLKSKRGKNAVVNRQPLDDDGNPKGGSYPAFKGLFLRATPGEADIEDDSDDDVIEFEILTHDE